MISKERSKSILEPTIEEIDKSEIAIPNLKFWHAIIGDEEPKSLKNMCEGYLNIHQKGLIFTCSVLPQKISKGLKKNMSLMVSYGAWQAAGIVGILAKHAIAAAVDAVKDSRKNPEDKSPEEMLSFVIPIVNIVHTESISISKGGFNLSEVNIIKIISENSSEKKSTYWIENEKEFGKKLFSLRQDEENRNK